MPLDYGLGLHDQQSVAPAGEEPPHEDPEDPIAVVDLCALDAASEYGDLLPKDDVLEGEPRSISEQRVDERKE